MVRPIISLISGSKKRRNLDLNWAWGTRPISKARAGYRRTATNGSTNKSATIRRSVTERRIVLLNRPAIPRQRETEAAQ
jgi:hypothetical protein